MNNRTTQPALKSMVKKVKHELKINPTYFSAVEHGDKRFEIRDNTDRGFQKGDIIILKEFDRNRGPVGLYSGRQIMAEIKFVTNYMQQPNYVVFGFSIITETQYDDDHCW